MKWIKRVSIKLSLLSIILTLGILLLSLLMYLTFYIYLPESSRAKHLEQANTMVDAIILATAEEAKERGFTASYIAALKKSKTPDSEILNKIKTFRQTGDKHVLTGFEQAQALADLNWRGDKFKQALSKAENKWENLVRIRQQIDNLSAEKNNTSSSEWIAVMTDFILSFSLLQQIAFTPEGHEEEAKFNNSIIKYAIWSISEYSGRERAIIAAAIASSSPLTTNQLHTLGRYRGIVEFQLSYLENVALIFLSNKNRQQFTLDMRENWQQIQNDFLGSFQQLREKIYHAAQTGKYPISSSEWLSQSTSAINTLLELNHFASIDAKHHTQLFGNTADSAFKIFLWLSLFILLLLIISLITTLRTIFRLSELKQTINQVITNKDLSLRAPVSSTDELGEIATIFNQLMKQFNQLIHQAVESAIDVTDSSSIMNQVASNAKDGIENQEIETVETTENLSLMIDTVTNVADKSNQASQLAHQAKEQSQHGSSVTQKSISSINYLATEINNAKDSIDSLKEQSHEIESIISGIQSIAEQTNLLALNAAIEAARAGEQGRGFAVVADEVRNLAQRTQKETEHIDSIITRLKQSTNDASEVMQLSNDKAIQSVNYINETGDAFSNISQSINAINEINGEIAQETEAQVDVFSNLSNNMQTNVKQFSLMLSESVEYTNLASQQLSDSIGGLLTMVDNYRVDANPQLQMYKAKANLLSWKNQVHGFLLDYTEMDTSNATDYHHCDFGKWYYSNDTIYLQGIEIFKNIEAPHKLQHEVLDKLVKLKNQGKNQEAQQVADELFNSIDQIVDLLEQLASKLGISRVSKIKDFSNTKTEIIDEDAVDFF
jgi:methyl-accepting chemotaxis protein